MKFLPNIFESLFGNRQTRVGLLEEYSELRIECEKLRADNAALEEQLAKYEAPLPGETFSETDVEEVPIVEDFAEQTTAETFESGTSVQISLEIPDMICPETTTLQSSLPVVESPPLIRIDKSSPNKEKIELFLSLFEGRKEYFAKYYFNKKTNSGTYTPVCDNEWDVRLCNKKTKEYTGAGKSLCAQCRHPAYMPFNADAVRDHLRGYKNDRNGRREDFIAGVYPLLDDNVCRFLAVDFDAHETDSNFV